MSEKNLIFENPITKKQIAWHDILKLEDLEMDDKNSPALNDGWERDTEFGSFHYRPDNDEQVKKYILPRAQSLMAINYEVAIAQPKDKEIKKDGVYFLLRRDKQE